jgi:hypothetical protein
MNVQKGIREWARTVEHKAGLGTYANPSVLGTEKESAKEQAGYTEGTNMLCTKSPNKLRYAESFDEPFVGLLSTCLRGDPSRSTFSEFLFRRAPCLDEVSTPEALVSSGKS